MPFQDEIISSRLKKLNFPKVQNNLDDIVKLNRQKAPESTIKGFGREFVERRGMSLPELVDRVTGSFGLRKDKTRKGKGFLGVLSRPSGGFSTEITIDVDLNGIKTPIPTLVPTLNQDEIDLLLAGKPLTPEIVRKAVDHAKQRISQRLSPFAE